MQWLRHAFSVESPGATEPTERQREIVERVCTEIVRRRAVTPTFVLLELGRPLSFLGAQAMHFFMPFLGAVCDTTGVQHFAAFLENRGAVDYICQRLEELEAAHG